MALPSESAVTPESDIDEHGAPPASMAPSHRVAAWHPSSVPPPREDAALGAVLDILLAAAHADGEMCAREARSIRQIMARLLAADCPEWVEERIRTFDVAGFSLDRAIEELRGFLPEHRRHVVEAVREVCDANHAYDIEEERYLLGVVLALSLTREDADDLVFDAADGVHGTAKRIFDVVFSSAALFAIWMLVLEKSPWPTLTLVVSLEAIFLSTFVMIGQNRQAAFQQAKADHDFQESELELKTNTELTREIHRLTGELHRRVLGAEGAGSSGNSAPAT